MNRPVEDTVIIGGRAHSVAEAQLIAQAGFPFAEISIRDPDEFHNQINSFRLLQKTYNIFYLAHGPEEENPWDPGGQKKQFLQLIKSLIDCAAQLSIALFTTHFWIDRRYIDGSIISEKLKILNDMSGYAQDHGIKLCIENLSENCSDFSKAFVAINNLGMTLDIGHGELLTEKNTAFDFIRDCFDRIHHLHLHDNRGGNTPKHDLHLPLGEGVIDFTSILRILRAQEYDKTMTLEVPLQFLVNGKNLIEEIWHQKFSDAQETSL